MLRRDPGSRREQCATSGTLHKRKGRRKEKAIEHQKNDRGRCAKVVKTELRWLLRLLGHENAGMATTCCITTHYYYTNYNNCHLVHLLKNSLYPGSPAGFICLLYFSLLFKLGSPFFPQNFLQQL